MKPWSIIAAALLAGCAYTPVDVRERGKPAAHPSRLQGAEFVACMQRAATDFGIYATARGGLKTGETEVLLQIPSEGMMITAAIFDVPGSGPITITENPEAFFLPSFRQKVLGGC